MAKNMINDAIEEQHNALKRLEESLRKNLIKEIKGLARNVGLDDDTIMAMDIRIKIQDIDKTYENDIMSKTDLSIEDILILEDGRLLFVCFNEDCEDLIYDAEDIEINELYNVYEDLCEKQ